MNGLVITLLSVFGAVAISVFLFRKRLRRRHGGNGHEIVSNHQFSRNGVELNDDHFHDNVGSKKRIMIDVDLT